MRGDREVINQSINQSKRKFLIVLSAMKNITLCDGEEHDDVGDRFKQGDLEGGKIFELTFLSDEKQPASLESELRALWMEGTASAKGLVSTQWMRETEGRLVRLWPRVQMRDLSGG